MPQPSNGLRISAKGRAAEKESFIKFLLEKCETATQPLALGKAMNEFKLLNSSSTTLSIMRSWLREYRKKIHHMPELESKTLAKQVFGLSMRATPTLIARLNKDANVEWGGTSPQFLKKYVANDGSLHLEGLPKSKAGRKKNSRTNDGNGEMDMEEETGEDDSSDGGLDPVSQVAKKRKTGTPRHSEVQNESEVSGSGSSTRNNRMGSPDAHRSGTTTQAQSSGSNLSVCKEAPVIKQEVFDETAQAQSTRRNPDASKNQTFQPNRGVEANAHQEQKLVPEVPKTRTIPFATHKKLLSSLPTLAEVMELQMDFRRLKRTVKLIENQENVGNNGGPEFKKLEIEDVSCALHYSIMKAKQCDEVKPGDNARSLQQYLTLLHFIIADSGIGELEKVKQKLKEEIKEIKGRDKLVAVSGISTSLGVVLDILIPK